MINRAEQEELFGKTLDMMKLFSTLNGKVLTQLNNLNWDDATKSGLEIIALKRLDNSQNITL